ncbi:hypothetical protein HYH03_000690 [Edaphochlamys debaryana]|uniref:Inositol-1-monophosphatase n=1 Tax=Edaphochlamys debaryana TaxID=47281 RepID=A0A835YQU9_9CHLO|nr:hypothetical protein HYH03_000690 [Edaphochlamys debaryana]|eukprot:KAG2502204.1 hypothetical protein HYH03_000690 [Edaphochlamys debaryana]
MSVPEALLQHKYVAWLEVAVEAATAAGTIIKGAFQGVKQVSEKLNHADLVTETDKAAEDLIFARIRRSFPDHALIGEESCSAAGGCGELGDGPTWMVDPLDGTTNFVHKFPFVCTSIAVAVGRVVVAGVVYNPVLDELFVAAAGGGAYLNGQRLAVSGHTQMAGALLGTEIGTARDAPTLDAMFGRLRALVGRMRAVRCSGSCALNLASVAAGRLDAFYEINFGGCWDAAAGGLLVAEAGGCVLDPAGGPWDVMARRVLGASSRELGQAVAAVLAGCELGPHEAGPPGPLPAGGRDSLGQAGEAQGTAEGEANGKAGQE